MKKIYCKKCGYKVFDSDAEYCPRCGARINDFHEVQKIEKTKKTRNILLIALILICITIAGVFSYAMFFNEKYQTVQVSQSASLEMPVGNGINATELDGYIHKFTNDKNVVIYSYNSNDKSMGGAISFSEMKTQAVGNPHNDNQIVEHQENGKTVYSITYGNDNTHDNIIITTTSKELTQKIFDSIKTVSSNNTTNNNSTSSSSSNSSKHIYGYADDGTPFYSQAELEKYIMEKGGYASYEDYLKTQNAPDGVAYYDGQPYYIDGDRYVDGSGSGSSSGGSSSQGGGSSEGGGAAPT